MPMHGDAYHGLAGHFAKNAAKYTEADPDAILAQVLVMFGNAVGRGPTFARAADPQHMNLFLALVGDTAMARKGTSFRVAESLFKIADPEWHKNRLLSGISSGEGLLQFLDKPDSGRDDKRGLVYLEEFGKLLTLMKREGNIISASLRDLFDKDRADVPTRKYALSVSGIHLSLIGHITPIELQSMATRQSSGNGFFNRFLWMTPYKTKVDAEGRNTSNLDVIVKSYADRLRNALTTARTEKVLDWSDRAFEIWRDFYEPEQEYKAELLARAVAHVPRLACIYALIDGSKEIKTQHAKAALAVWRYSKRSVEFLFPREFNASPEAMKFLKAISEAGDQGMTRSEIFKQVFKGHIDKEELDAVIESVKDQLERTEETVGTRKLTRFFLRRNGGR